RLVEGARPMLDQFIQDVASDANVPDRITALRTITSLLVKVRDQTTREIYAGQLAGILKMEPQQVRRAMQEAAAVAQRQARPQDGAARPSVNQAAPAAAPTPPARLPAEELELLAVLAQYPELLGTPAGGRGGELLVHPLARQLNRAAVELCAGTGELDIPAWLETAGVADRATIAAAVGNERFASISDPPSYLRKLVIRLEILRVDAEIAMNTRLQKDAQSRGDEDASNALSRRGVELRQTKQGLKTALQRP